MGVYLPAGPEQPIENIHEVISLVETGKNEIVDVVSKGYLLNGAPIRYPKVILGK